MLLTGLGLLELQVVIYPRLLTGFGMLVFLTNLCLTEFQVRYLVLIFSFLSNRWLWLALYGKSSQEDPVDVWVPQGCILGLILFPLYISDFLNDFISNIGIYADYSTLYLSFNQGSDLWQQLELAFELEFDLQGTVDWGRKWLFDFKTWKTQLILFFCLNSTSAIDEKMDGSVHEEKSSCNILGLTFCSKLHLGCWLSLLKWFGTLTLSLLLKLTSGKLEPWFVMWSSFLLGLLCISINLP